MMNDMFAYIHAAIYMTHISSFLFLLFLLFLLFPILATNSRN